MGRRRSGGRSRARARDSPRRCSEPTPHEGGSLLARNENNFPELRALCEQAVRLRHFREWQHAVDDCTELALRGELDESVERAAASHRAPEDRQALEEDGLEVDGDLRARGRTARDEA